jgi:DNA-binding transcriptional MerR regulator
MERYKATEIIALTGITKMQLNHWINMGAILPAEDDRRRGGVRYFSEENLFEALVCKFLNEHGLPVQLITSIVHCIRNPAPHRKQQSFFKTFKINQKMEDSFLIAAHFTFYTRNGKRKDFLSANQELPENEKKRVYDLSRYIEICPAAKLAENLLKYPTAIVVNLTSIANEVIKA